MNKIKKTNKEWKKILSSELFEIARNSGTEKPYTGKYNDVYTEGQYHCACCNTPLFSSETKFPTYCGWPGFSKPIKNDNINEYSDSSIPERLRTEVKCRNCDAHLGHVFNDGPEEMGGLRYCINSLSLILKKS